VGTNPALQLGAFLLGDDQGRHGRHAAAPRAWILLLAGEGVTNTEIADRVGVSRPTVIACRRRYVRRGLAGLPDRPRPGRPQTVRRARRAEVLSVTLTPPPRRLGITHWSTRLLARELAVSRDTVRG